MHGYDIPPPSRLGIAGRSGLALTVFHREIRLIILDVSMIFFLFPARATSSAESPTWEKEVASILNE